ncbi:MULTISPECIES: hypothetical protein [Rhizobium]|jgi:hypothetical protein|uniref:Uncharacterized protein n=1 Tax=Rhizobium wenxiniae TaxID=1737357 RepID=A0A7W9Y2C5_9HYPH|nr:hypothetical protein [Rhizobium wenxiniae]MBB6160709.1 hypothetical protein [Rhizobium wenxiniae]GGF83572.1 hypothetical protein GCM10010924_08620 [Rhizobium wenxiniae]
MGMNENSANLGTAHLSRARGVALNPLHEAAMRLAGLGLTRSKEKTRDLVSLLLSHGARAWRQSQPEAGIHLHVAAHSGRAPVRMKLPAKTDA